jgi:hypothetical protein
MSDGTFIILSSGRTIFENGANKTPVTVRRGRRAKKNSDVVIHPIFRDAVEFAEKDPYWIKILDNASKGIFPKMYRYNNWTLSFKQKNKVFSQEICQLDPELCLRNIQDFMRSNGSHSKRDHAMIAQEVENLKSEAAEIELEWRSIRSKKMKMLLISNYLDYLKIHYKLQSLECSALFNMLRLAYSSGLINVDTVVMENNRIVDISILCYDPKTRIFFIDGNAVFPKPSNATLKKIIDCDEDNNEASFHNVRMGKSRISKSRLTDWDKFSSTLGKRIATHSNLENFRKNLNAKRKATDTYNETSSPISNSDVSSSSPYTNPKVRILSAR